MKSNAQQQRWLIKINAWPAGGIAGKPTDEATGPNFGFFSRRVRTRVCAEVPYLITWQELRGNNELKDRDQAIRLVAFVTARSAASHPGGNITGFMSNDPAGTLGGKWVELLKQIAPRTVRVALLFNPATAVSLQYTLPSIQAAASSFAIQVSEAPVHAKDEIEGVIAAQARDPGGGLIVSCAYAAPPVATHRNDQPG